MHGIPYGTNINQDNKIDINGYCTRTADSKTWFLCNHIFRSYL